MSTTSSLSTTLEGIRSFEQQVHTAQAEINRERRRANIVMRSVLILLACMVLVNLQFVYMLTTEFRTVLRDMVAMYEHFGRVADRMDSMSGYMQSMEQDMRLMPVMHEQMVLMNQRMSGMSGTMGTMSTDMQNMQQQVGTMEQGISGMSQRFRHLNHNVGGMGRDVGSMADVVP